jgi:hypothetical protein
MLKIEKGKFYRTRDGRKVGPMRDFWDSGFFVKHGDGQVWERDGSTRAICKMPVGLEIVAEWTDEPEIDLTAITTPFGLLPEEVQRALQQCRHAIEYWCWSEGWVGLSSEPSWVPYTVYRAKPQPPKPVVKDVPLVVWVDGVKTRTTWTFTDGQMTPVAAVEVLK